MFVALDAPGRAGFSAGAGGADGCPATTGGAAAGSASGGADAGRVAGCADAGRVAGLASGGADKTVKVWEVKP